MTEEKLHELKNATRNDNQWMALANNVQVRWPESRLQVPDCVFWNYRDEITVINGIIYNGPAVIPTSLRRQILI